MCPSGHGCQRVAGRGSRGRAVQLELQRARSPPRARRAAAWLLGSSIGGTGSPWLPPRGASLRHAVAVAGEPVWEA
eukprot:1183404-Lingulodinium_polyedra.AAC.1